jgi:NTP pyrophosphatase (non-canonical NTP hydrolase)
MSRLPNSTVPAWFSEAARIHIKLLDRNRCWPAWSAEDRNFLALSLAGEVGELANCIKKLWDRRRTGIPSAAAIASELADVRILTELLAFTLNVDLDSAVEAKLREVDGREL